MNKKEDLKKQLKKNKVNLSLLGILAITYYAIFVVVGIYSLQVIFFMLKGNIFGNILYTISYIISWMFAYFAGTGMCIKLLLQHRINKSLKFFSLLWFLEIFWTAWALIPDVSEHAFDIAIFMTCHLVFAHPYLYYVDHGFGGKVLAITPPLVNLVLCLIAWIKPQLFYKKIELKEAAIDISIEETKE